jgi:hypothetical protein
MNKQIVKTVLFDELPSYPVRRSTHRNERQGRRSTEGDRVNYSTVHYNILL